MELLVETLSGATEFDGTAGKGLVDFSDLALPPDLNTKPRILTISVDTGNTAITMPRIICQITRPGGVACERILIRDITDKNGFALAGCAIPVPREIGPSLAPTGTPWILQLFTPGKDVDACFIVEYVNSTFRGDSL